MSEEKNVLSASESEYGSLYKQHLFEQYQLYFNAIETNSDRRQAANRFFILLNTALFTLVGFTINLGNPLTKLTSRISISIAGIIVCIIFFLLIRSYRQLASGKFKVLHELEEILPARLFDREWDILERGKNRKIYYPFSHIELWIPKLFGLGYLVFSIIAIIFFVIVQ
jgi:hypothetical protein